MSPAEIRRRALLAAAKVTFSFLAFGCASESVDTSDDRTGSSVNNAGGSSGGTCAASAAACAGSGGSSQAGSSQAGSSQAGSSQAGSGGQAGGGQAGGEQAGAGGQGPAGAAGQGTAGAGGEGTAGAGGSGAGAGGGEGQACGKSPEPPYAQEQVGCCVKMVEATFPDPNVAPPESLSPEQLGCCKVVVGARDEAANKDPGAPEAIPWMVAYNCCPYLEPSQTLSPTCTPWGPPTPPEMPAWLENEEIWEEVA